MGRDHLLAVYSSGYSEDYKRFYFRDIQAVILRKTSTGKTTNFIFGGLAVLPLAAALTHSLTDGFGDAISITWWVIGGVVLLPLLSNILTGPTCKCYMKTAVQTEELPSLRRLRRARKVLARIRPLIAEAQGELTPGEIAARMRQPSQSGTAAAAGASASENYIVPFDPPAA